MAVARPIARPSAYVSSFSVTVRTNCSTFEQQRPQPARPGELRAVGQNARPQSGNPPSAERHLPTAS
jgi:hypothetical protein